MSIEQGKLFLEKLKRDKEFGTPGTVLFVSLRFYFFSGPGAEIV